MIGKPEIVSGSGYPVPIAQGKVTPNWHLARAKALSIGLSNAYFQSLGLPSFIDEVTA
jgi:hypothetical protein